MELKKFLVTMKTTSKVINFSVVDSQVFTSEHSKEEFEKCLKSIEKITKEDPNSATIEIIKCEEIR